MMYFYNYDISVMVLFVFIFGRIEKGKIMVKNKY